MNFVNGKSVSEKECAYILEHIDGMIMQTLQKPPLDVNLVINACDTLVKNIGSSPLMKRLPELGVNPVLAGMYLEQLAQTLGAEAIRERMKIELGEGYDKQRALKYSHSGAEAVQTVAPLGVLFHITAGNAGGLPFISLLDGLLTGNINIVKLPKEEGGITVSLLEELFAVEPSLREYVYVFDYSSKDVHAMKKLADAANAVVVWGGDEAVSAVRKLAAPNTKIIEWGHKISFAYVTKAGAVRAALEKLALHIALTDQLFCSSCQGVFLDTGDMEDVNKFCEDFLPVFDGVCRDNPTAAGGAAAELFVQAEITLEDYRRQIENDSHGVRLFRGQNCSITARPDSKLEPSAQYRNIWAKPLKREDIIRLRSYKGYLQTAALICAEHEHSGLSRSLLQTGIVKISDGFEMSSYAFGEAHDGIFPLKCYTRTVSVQVCPADK